ncbi:hypothetical protein B0H67DRAFT_573172 [Lasiosphaeris hirsuta]|uniref:CFEM domain-containing protein n=1 Tax=Lasiosphaeris hirsuta TaxID=260670 RepID=A0AA40AP65_9PEZI|nr:hypothetical protein B0H67DRAFT_573172 [Lasiosphaeris hirsuta]
MKLSATLLSLALATVAVAQAPSLPTCAQGCANQYLLNGIGDCGTDPKCICGNADFIVGISCCLAGACEPADQSSAVNFASLFCSGQGVTTLPTTVSCATTSGGTAAATNSASTTASGSTAAKTTVSSGPSNTGTTAGGAAATTSKLSTNYGPRQTAAPIMGAIGGIMAAVAML